MGVCCSLPKTLTLIMTKICDFLYPTDQKFDTVFLTVAAGTVTLHIRAFVDGLINNREKVASSKDIPNSRLECQNHTLFKTKINALFMTKTAETHTLWGCTYQYSPYKGVPPKITITHHTLFMVLNPMS